MLVLSGPSQIRRAFARKIFRGLLIVGFAQSLFVAAGTRQLGELFIGGFFLAKDFLQENRSLRVDGEFVIEAPRSGDLAPLPPSPMPRKLLAHENRDCIAGASTDRTGPSPANWRNPSRSR
jgi:hypothetical protein